MDAQRTAITQTNPAPESLQRQASPQPTKARWRVLFLISLMYLICYMDRSSISVAAPGISREFGLSRTQMAIVFSVFAWAYAIGQNPTRGCSRRPLPVREKRSSRKHPRHRWSDARFASRRMDHGATDLRSSSRERVSSSASVRRALSPSPRAGFSFGFRNRSAALFPAWHTDAHASPAPSLH